MIEISLLSLIVEIISIVVALIAVIVAIINILIQIGSMRQHSTISATPDGTQKSKKRVKHSTQNQQDK